MKSSHCFHAKQYLLYFMQWNGTVVTATSASDSRDTRFESQQGYRSSWNFWGERKVVSIDKFLLTLRALHSNWKSHIKLRSLELVLVVPFPNTSHSRVGNTSVSYSEGPGFKFRIGTSILRVFSDFIQTVRANSGIVPQIKQRPLRSTFIPIHYSLSRYLSTLYILRYWQGS
jgi:hypothetical protein